MNNYIWTLLVIAGVYAGFLICAAITCKRRGEKRPAELPTETPVLLVCAPCGIPMVRTFHDLVGIEGVREYLMVCVKCNATVSLNCMPDSPLHQEMKLISQEVHHGQ